MQITRGHKDYRAGAIVRMYLKRMKQTRLPYIRIDIYDVIDQLIQLQIEN